MATQYSCPENLVDRGAWQATVHRVAKSWTRLTVHTILDNLLNISKPQFPHLQNGDNSTHFTGGLGW